MKKFALTSLMAVFAVSGAHAANVIDGNPLYMPGQNHFYSVTDLSSHTGEVNKVKQIKDWTLAEEFGYGILDNLAVNVRTAFNEEQSFDRYGMGDLGLKVTFRALDLGAWKADLYGEYAMDGNSIFDHIKDDKTYWFDKDHNGYTWMAGIRGGYTTSVFTVAGRVEFAYENDESFNWNEEGAHSWTVALDGQYVINNDWNLVSTIAYKGYSDSSAKNDGHWFGEMGVNYNIDETKFVGAYINGSLNHHDGDAGDDWGWDEGFGFGAKFGIDF